MKKKTRIPGIVLLLGLGGLVWWLMRRRGKEGEGAEATITIVPAEEGEGIGAIATIEEGKGGIAIVTVTNKSTKGGTPWGVMFDIFITITTPGRSLANIKDTQSFTAGQSKTLSYSFSTAYGDASVGSANVKVTATGSAIVLPGASAETTFTITVAAIVYGAGVTWT